MKREALRPAPRGKIQAQLKRLKRFKAERSGWHRPLTALARVDESAEANVFASNLNAARADVTHGEICRCCTVSMGLASR